MEPVPLSTEEEEIVGSETENSLNPPIRAQESEVSDSKQEESDASGVGKNKFALPHRLEQKLSTECPEVLDLIAALRKYIAKQTRKLKKLRAKLKSIQSHRRDVAAQTEDVAAKTLSEEIKEAAEAAVQNTGFVYEETSGMYYDYSTGYYYNAEHGLYYDGNTGTYMKYNGDTKQYEFHSQVAVPPLDNRSKTKESKVISADLEGLTGSLSRMAVATRDRVAAEASSAWPPCMRIIVKSTTIADVKVGSLHIVTFEGGTIGREGGDHSIVLPDINVSKHHLRISFDGEAGKYRVTDLGSRNGTLLNGKRISASKQESEAVEVVHGSQVQVGATVLLCHVHKGNLTCGHCEPGLQPTPEEVRPPVKLQLGGSKSRRHKTELQKLKRKFGVNRGDENGGQLAAGYTDRAQERREVKGSQNPYEKTEVASVHDSIGEDNKGFKLLAKMGWSSGQALGKVGGGLLQPIEVTATAGEGIGFANPLPNVGSDAAATSKKQEQWKQAQERFRKLPDVVHSSDDDGSD